MKRRTKTSRPPFASAIQGALLRAFEDRPDRLTLDELLRLSGLDCSTESVSRKLRGTQVLFCHESDALAKALRVGIVIAKPDRLAA